MEKEEWTLERVNSFLSTKLGKDEQCLSLGKTSNGMVFLTSKRLILVQEYVYVGELNWHSNPKKEAPEHPVIEIPLESVKAVDYTRNKNLDLYKKLTVMLGSKGWTGLLNLPLIAVTDGKNIYPFVPEESIDPSPIFNSPKLLSSVKSSERSMEATAKNWVYRITNAVRNRKIEALHQGLIKAWECRYCKTINEMEDERCSYCGSPRRN